MIASFACLWATIYQVEIPSKTPRTDAFREEVARKAAKMEQPAFVPNEEKTKAIQSTVQKADTAEEKKGEEEKKEEEEIEEPEPQTDVNDV